MRPSPNEAVRRRLESIPNAAEYVGVSTKTIRRWIDAGRITGLRAGPKLIRVDLDEVDAMLVEITALAVIRLPDAPATLCDLPAPDEVACRRLLALLVAEAGGPDAAA